MIQDFLLYFFIFGAFLSGSWLFYCAKKTQNHTPFLKSLNFRTIFFGGGDDLNKSKSLLIVEGIICFIVGFAFLWLLF